MTRLPRKGDRLGRWTLQRPIGKGGNAIVWQAVDDEGARAALKILRRRGDEALARFTDEVCVLRSLSAGSGVLPLLDASIPESRGRAAWLAMPLATPIHDALGENPTLEEVVEVIRDVAAVLATLHAEGIAHRDIKPANLFRHQGRWAVGDLGLATYPDKEALTQENKKLGPAWYIAPEMLNSPSTADALPADVYSLAKTMWVLATGQRYPVQGEQRLDRPEIGIRSQVAHARAGVLDVLIEDMTAHNPERRPTMEQVAGELRSWLEPGTVTSGSDLSDLAVRIAAATASSRRIRDEAQALADRFAPTWQQAEEGLQTVGEEYRKALGQGTVVLRSGEWARDVVGFSSFSTGRDQEVRQSPGLVTSTDVVGVYAPYLLSGIAMRLYADGLVEMRVAHVSGHGGRQSETLWSGSAEAPAGSARAERAVKGLIAGLLAQLRPAFETFTTALEKWSALHDANHPS